jgi:hypothetical protein
MPMPQMIYLILSFAVSAPIVFFAFQGEGNHYFLSMAVMQLILLALAMLSWKKWLYAYGFGLGGAFAGHFTRILYDHFFHLYDHNLFPIELAIGSILFIAWMIPGALCCLLTMTLARKMRDKPV